MKPNRSEMVHDFLLANATAAVPGILFVVTAIFVGIAHILALLKY